MYHLRTVRLVLTSLVSLLVLALVTPASAAKPIREVIPAGGPVDFAPNELCSFPVRITPEGKTIRLTFSDSSGGVPHVIETYPRARQTVTNLTTGETIRVSLAGPGFFDEQKVVGSGPWTWHFNPFTGETGFFQTFGRWSYNIADNSFTLRDQMRIIDLCAELSS